MDALDQVSIEFLPQQLRLLNWILGFLLFGIALDLKWEQFQAITQQKKKVAIGLSSQWVLLPVLTIGLIYFFRPPDSIALGMLLISVCPGGNISNYAVHLSKSNTALSVILTTCSTAACVLLTPLLFMFLLPYLPIDNSWQGALQISPLDTLLTITKLIVIPLLLGMACQRWLPRFTQRIKKPVSWLSLLLFLGIVVSAIMTNLENLQRYLMLVLWIVISHNALALAAGYFWAKSFKLPAFDARAISIETGIQNSGLGLILIFNFFDGLGGMALVAAGWGIWHLISSLSLATFWGYVCPTFSPKKTPHL